MLTEKNIPKWLSAPAFGAIMAAAGIAAGGRPVGMTCLAAALVGAYLYFGRRGWLLSVSGAHGARDAAVTSVFSALTGGFVLLTGGPDSPLPCALYLPIFFAALCYGTRLGLLTSLGMAGAALAFALGGLGGRPLPHPLPAAAVAVGLSFPLAAVIAGVLRAQMEARLRALSTEKHALSTEKQELSALLDLSQMMESAFDLDMTLNLVLLNVQQHSECQVCAVYLKDSDGRTMELRAASGPGSPIGLRPTLTLDGAGVGGWSTIDVSHGHRNAPAFYVPDATAGRAAGTDGLFVLDPQAGSFACLPMSGVEGLLGMIYLGYGHPNGLTPEGLSRLEQLAVHAAFPLQRVLMQQDYRSLAYSDAMTGLDNFRQFEQTLADELARAERYGRSLSVILLDIDHFKSFNDTLGHPAGDALLGQMGVVLRNSLRNVDRPARYGGEEFVVICPETGADGVHLIAERIRRAVAETAFTLGETGETTRVTVSLGCATFPVDARTTHDLVKKADMALYDAKEAGRNTVRAYDTRQRHAEAA
jgi:diguanylate cyclase (GGDEF)-like protein